MLLKNEPKHNSLFDNTIKKLGIKSNLPESLSDYINDNDLVYKHLNLKLNKELIDNII